MTKFHINSKGVPARCNAKKGNCPFGGESGNENHFETHKEAYEFSKQLNEEKYGLFPGVDEINIFEIEEEDLENERKRIEAQTKERPRYFVFDNGSTVHKEKDYYRLLNNGRKVVKEIYEGEDFPERFDLEDSLTENHYREVTGLTSPPEGLSISEEREFYLSQEEIEPGIKYGPHKAKLQDYETKSYISDYLGPNLSRQSEDAIKFAKRTTAGSALILPEKSKAKGIRGFFGSKHHTKGILIEKLGSDFHKEAEHREVFQIYYIDERGIEKAKEKVGEKGGRVFE